MGETKRDRMVLIVLLIAAACATRVQMEPAPRPVPSLYAHEGRTAASESLPLTFAVKMRNLEDLEIQWVERSNPKSASYAQWMSRDETVSRYAPTAETMASVRAALAAAGASEIVSSPNGFIAVRMARDAAETLLDTEFHQYRNSETKEVLHRAVDGQYSLPAELARHIDFVEGVRRLPTPTLSPKLQTPSLRQQKRIGLGITPKVVRKHYQTLGVEGKNSNTSQAVGSFIGQFFSVTSLNEFYALFSPESKGTQFIVHGPNGGAAGIEADLDVQYLSSSGLKIAKNYVWSVPNSEQNPFIYLFAELANLTEIPMLFSISYGEPEKGNTVDYLHRLDQEFAVVGLRGVSIQIAAGDSGVATGGCTDSTFGPDWPSTSPHVVSVGGTQLGLFDLGDERAWNGGGGGFSNVFPMPEWQKAAVQHYLTTYKSSLPDPKYYNVTGRAFPDIAGFANDVLLIHGGVPTPVGGTSCATPICSGVISLLNDHQLQNGKPQLGPLNQWIYQNMKSFNDITKGANEGCDGQSGFPATLGWDGCTGVGSPLYARMVTALP